MSRLLLLRSTRLNSVVTTTTTTILRRRRILNDVVVAAPYSRTLASTSGSSNSNSSSTTTATTTTTTTLSEKLHLVSPETITPEFVPLSPNINNHKKASGVVPSSAPAAPAPPAAILLYADLAKAKLSALVVSTTAAGFIAAGPMASVSVMTSCLIGTALCSSSAAAYNQIFEIDRDTRMKRTQQRPLVQGQLSIPNATLAATVWGVTGTGLLYVGTDPVTTTLGVSNIFLYSGIYTYMKPRSIYNTWVGAVVGAIPPVMGWTAASAAATAATAVSSTSTSADSSILFLLSQQDYMPAVWLGTTLYLWQMPHFFALSYMHRMDYARGGFAMLPCVEERHNAHTDHPETAAVIVRYAWYLSAVPFLATLTNTTSSMFAMEGIPLNAYALYVAHKFQRDRTNANARKVFLTSLWYLPTFLVLFLLHSKTFQDDVEMDEKVKGNILADWIQQSVLTARNKGRELCVHEAVIQKHASSSSLSSSNAAGSSTADACPITVGTQKAEATTLQVQQVATELVHEVQNQQQQHHNVGNTNKAVVRLSVSPENDHETNNNNNNNTTK